MAGVAEHPIKSNELSTFSCTLLEMNENKELLPRVRKKGTKLSRMPKKPDDFVFLRILGEGAYSTVYLVRELCGGQIQAAKVVEKDFINRHQKMAAIIREKNILASLTYEQGGHPFVIQLHCTFHDSQRLYFVTDVAERGDLLDALNRLGTFDIPSARFYAAEIVVALEFIHSHGVVHRDLKPENVLIRRSGHIMLTDFGSAQIYDEKLFVHYEEEKDDTSTQVGKLDQERNNSEAAAESSSDSSSETEEDGPEVPDRPRRATFVGTAQYVSPEMLRGEEVGPPCDYWALGAIVFQLISGQAPFRAINDFHLMNKIQKLDLSFPDDFPELVKDLVAKLLVLDPAVRLGTGNLSSLKSHAFFEGTNWMNIENTTPPDILPPMSKSMEEVGNSDVLIQPGLDEKALGRLMNSSLLGIELEQPYLDGQDPYSTVRSSTSMTFGRESLATRDRKLEKQRKENPYHPFVQDNLIIRSGFIDKKKGLFARRRMFLLTEGPHLFYVDPNSMELKGEVPWSPCMRAEAKNFRAFWVYTPKRIYYLFDPESRALEWCKAIEQMKTRYADEIAESYEKAVRDGTFGVNAYKKPGNYFGNKRRKGRNRSQV
ncbi:unnamed protein product [Cylicocyclus nassatus]|uniref:3-phosphoinositide-dependent protein kinase 1 n=1 Tax=Cylicocyclus nassatus TaxID=53992 RepID=A0AA36GRG8_CYLNA|nr:unnamed protein product [Cylicocyclus nassatus]